MPERWWCSIGQSNQGRANRLAVVDCPGEHVHPSVSGANMASGIVLPALNDAEVRDAGGRMAPGGYEIEGLQKFEDRYGRPGKGNDKGKVRARGGHRL